MDKIKQNCRYGIGLRKQGGFYDWLGNGIYRMANQGDVKGDEAKIRAGFTSQELAALRSKNPSAANQVRNKYMQLHANQNRRVKGWDDAVKSRTAQLSSRVAAGVADSAGLGFLVNRDQWGEGNHIPEWMRAAAYGTGAGLGYTTQAFALGGAARLGAKGLYRAARSSTSPMARSIYRGAGNMLRTGSISGNLGRVAQRAGASGTGLAGKGLQAAGNLFTRKGVIGGTARLAGDAAAYSALSMVPGGTIVNSLMYPKFTTVMRATEDITDPDVVEFMGLAAGQTPASQENAGDTVYKRLSAPGADPRAVLSSEVVKQQGWSSPWQTTKAFFGDDDAKYNMTVEAFKNNPELARSTGAYVLDRVAGIANGGGDQKPPTDFEIKVANAALSHMPDAELKSYLENKFSVDPKNSLQFVKNMAELSNREGAVAIDPRVTAFMTDKTKQVAKETFFRDPLGSAPALVSAWLRSKGVGSGITGAVENPWVFYGGLAALLLGGLALFSGGGNSGRNNQAPSAQGATPGFDYYKYRSLGMQGG